MTVSLTALTTEVQARCNALTGSSTIDEVIEQAIAAKKVERAGSVIERTVLDTQLQRVINLSGGSSQIEDLIALAASVEAPGESGAGFDSLPINILAPFIEGEINFTDEAGREWLKTGYVTDDVEEYPDALLTELAPTSSEIVATIATSGFRAITYSPQLNLIIVASSSNKIDTATPDGVWSQQVIGYTLADLCVLSTGRIIGVTTGGYVWSDDAVTWTFVATSGITFTAVCATKFGYWVGVTGSKIYSVLDSGAPVDLGSFANVNDAAYSPELDLCVFTAVGAVYTKAGHANAGAITARTVPTGIYVGAGATTEHLLIVGNSGKIAKSVDGITWVDISISSSVNFRHVIYMESSRAVLVVGGVASGNWPSYFSTSTDLVSWTSLATIVVNSGNQYPFGLISVAGIGAFTALSPSVRLMPTEKVVGVPVRYSPSARVCNYMRIK